MITIIKREGKQTDERVNIIPLSNIENKKINLDGWDITVTFPIEEKHHVKQGYLIESETKEDGIQPFVIHNYEFDKNLVTITAYHVMYETKDLLVEEFSRKNVTATNALILLNDNTDRQSPFTITGNVEELVDVDVFAQSLLESMRAILQRTDAYITADGYNIHITDKIGMDTHESISYGKNLYNFSYREDFDSVVTRVYPYFQIGEDQRITLPEKYVTSDYAYNKTYTQAVQFEPSVELYEEPEEYEDGKIEEQPPLRLDELVQDLRFQAERMLLHSQFPKISYKISSTLNVNFRIGDIVHFKHPALTKAVPLEGNDFEGLSIPIEVYSYEYDVVSGTLNALTYGDLESNPYDKIKDFATEIVIDETKKLSDFISDNLGLKDQLDRIKYNINKDIEGKQSALDDLAGVIQNLNKNGHLVVYENELYALDKLPIEEAENVLNLGQGGITFSTNGINGPWNAAISIDGKINASQILTGELDASIIKTNTIKSDALSIEAKDYIVSLTSGKFQEIQENIDNIELNKTFFAYSPNSDGKNMTPTPDNNSRYIGTCSGKTRPLDYKEYTWSLFKGEDGTSGTGIASSLVEYTISDNGEEEPEMGWQTNLPELVEGKYFWTKGTINYTDGTKSETYSVTYIPRPGNGIKSTEIRYQQSTSGTDIPTGTWTETIPTPIKGQFLWTRTELTLDDNTVERSYSTSYYATDGQKGDKGDTGSKGETGTSTYTHIKYATSSTGNGMTDTPSSGRKYMGISVTNSPTPPSKATAYIWSKYLGDDGAQGDKGDTTYTWVRYADTPTSGISQNPEGKAWQGLAHNKTTPSNQGSNNYNDYHWTPLPQNISVGGRNYLLNSGDKVDFEEQDVVPTTVEEYLPTDGGRNLIPNSGVTKQFTEQVPKPQVNSEFELEQILTLKCYFKIQLGDLI